MSLLNPYQSSFAVATLSTKQSIVWGHHVLQNKRFFSHNPQSEAQLHYKGEIQFFELLKLEMSARQNLRPAAAAMKK